MRYVKARLVPGGRPIHPFVAAVAADGDAHGGHIHQLQQVDADSLILFCEAFGDLDRYRELAAECDAVLDCALSGSDRGYAFLHLRLTPITRAVLDIHDPEAVTFKYPIHFDEEGALVVTLVGDDGAFRDAVGHLPADLAVEVAETGEYTPETKDVYARLTDRQREVLDAALSTGYYEYPRRATQADVAEAVGVTRATVAEHLQKIEAQVFEAFLRR